MYVCVSGSKKCNFFGKLCVITLKMAPNSVFIDASVMHLKAIILQIFIKKSWFGWATNYKKMCQKLKFFKNFSPVQTIVVPLGETNISKLLAALFFFIRPPLFESWFGGPVTGHQESHPCYRKLLMFVYGTKTSQNQNRGHFTLLILLLLLRIKLFASWAMSKYCSDLKNFCLVV